MLPNVGGGELVIVLILLLLLFGTTRIPELAKALGAGIREFRKGASGEKYEVRERDKEKKAEGRLDQTEGTARDKLGKAKDLLK